MMSRERFIVHLSCSAAQPQESLHLVPPKDLVIGTLVIAGRQAPEQMRGLTRPWWGWRGRRRARCRFDWRCRGGAHSCCDEASPPLRTLCRETVNVLLEGTPVGLAFEEVEQAMLDVPGVMAVGDLHLWSLTSGIDALSAHVALEESTDPSTALCDLEDVLRTRFNLEHTTIQLEGPGSPECPLRR